MNYERCWKYNSAFYLLIIKQIKMNAQMELTLAKEIKSVWIEGVGIFVSVLVDTLSLQVENAKMS